MHKCFARDFIARASVANDGFIAGEMIREQVRRFGRTPFPVLLTGEFGTGKGRTARAIHESSDRAGRPFISVNCVELPLAELVGQRRGKPGQIEFANGGTLFLEEVGELSVEAQGHVMRLLSEQRIFRLGDTESSKVDIRVMASSCTDLLEAAVTGTMRTALYYGLSVLTIHLPPLRQRLHEIEALCAAILPRICLETGVPQLHLQGDAIRVLRGYDWPGNITELVSVLRRAVLLCDGPRIRADHIQLDPGAGEVTRRPAPGTNEEKQMLLSALAENSNNITKAALQMRVSRVTAYRMLSRHGIDVQQRIADSISTDSARGVS